MAHINVIEGARQTRVPGGRTIQEIEADFRKPGNTTFYRVFGFDLFDFWVGPFYVGFWGFIGALAGAIGALFYLYGTVFLGPYSYAQNFFAGRIDPPPPEAGMSLVAAWSPGFIWQVTVIATTITFFCWMMRQVDISMKLNMGYHVAVSYGVVFSAWITLQILRPALLGQWAEGFTLGIMPHLDWIVNFGYRYNNFFYNPFHAIGISGLFFTTFLLACHGSAILSGAQSRDPDVTSHINDFWRDIQFYSIGEAGIHRAGALAAAGAILVSNLCILFSGWPVQDWVSFWNFWNALPWWSGV